ncbi:uncharacterized protein LOC127736658 [Mytilus californianus]|uniref:uncharacterized protein LOC127736658 n=1 Tax=Mytilus californianus TaxID=6549 RepID=UPI00224568F1|nr:uncharacterized protein LOC127736658 [Mytilus californianus]
MTIFSCTTCNFLTEQKNKWDRHCATTRHQTFTFLCSQLPCDFADVESDYNVEEAEDEHHRHQIEVEPPLAQDTPMETDSDGYLELNDGYLELGDVDQEHADFSQRIQSEVENETADSTTYMYNQEPEHENWHPFSSKAECLLYILMNSSTHHVVSMESSAPSCIYVA